MPKLDTRNVTRQSIALFLSLVAVDARGSSITCSEECPVDRNNRVARQPGGTEGYLQGDLCGQQTNRPLLFKT